MCTYKAAETAVRIEDGNGEWFKFRVGLHQGSARSPLLFIIVMYVISR